VAAQVARSRSKGDTVSVLSAAVAQLVHIALMVAAAPTVAGLHAWLRATLAGRAGPSVLQPWHDLARLLRKQPVLAENASWLTENGVAFHAAATGLASCIVPSFSLGMSSAGLADLLVVFGLLAAARIGLALAAVDVGAAPAGMAVSRQLLLGCLVEPASLLVLLVLATLAGTSNLDLIAAMQVESGPLWQPAPALAAVLALAWSDTSSDDPALVQDLSGVDLALTQVGEGLRLLVWFGLIGAMFLPIGMASPDAGPVAWLVGLGGWLVRTLVLTGMLALAQTMLGRVRPLRTARMLGMAMLLSLLAVVIVFAGMGSI
jgi:formate hydrogenlyase subunit 4